MRFYELTYTIKDAPHDVLEEWPAARTFFALDDSFQYSSDEIRQFVKDFRAVKCGLRINEWFGSERDAVVRRLELWNAGKLVGKKKDHEIWPVDIPTRKEDLLAWLRVNCVDNT